MFATTQVDVDSAPRAVGSAAWRAWLGGPWIRPFVAVAGMVALVIGGTLPVWGTRLQAPQYPKGLELWFYGNRVEGPVREVNGLNHYIGMQSIDLAKVPEMALWPLGVVATVALLLMALLWHGWLSRIALLLIWLIPLVILADIQRWLYIFGQELDPRAALDIEGFVPLALGTTEVWNFSVLTFPGAALMVIWAVALVATVARRAREPEPRLRNATAAVAMIVAVVGTVLVVPIGVADAALPEDGGEAPTLVGDGALHPQSLIDAAEPRAEVTVPEGRYRVNLVIDKPITLVAEGEVRLDGGGHGSVITVRADDVTVRGFHITHTGGQLDDAAGIRVEDADRVSIEKNEISDFFHGISGLGVKDLRVLENTLLGTGLVSAAAAHVTGALHDAPADAQGAASMPGTVGAEGMGAEDVDVEGMGPAGPRGQGDAVYLWNAEAVVVARNEMADVRDGVYMAFARDVLIDSNQVRASRYGFHSMFGGPVTVFGNDVTENLAGLVFMYTKDVLAGRNVISDQRSAATGFGIVLKDVEGIRLAENVVSRNRVGLMAEGTRMHSSRPAEVLRNRFDSNGTAVTLFSSSDIGFGANTFEGNMTDVLAEGSGVSSRNDWTYQGTGNHWSAYAGYDLDGDGVGDVAHTTSGAVEILTSEAPALELYRGSLALHALESAQELWEGSRSVAVRDSAPRVDDYAPTTADLRPPADPASVADDSAAWYATGAVLATGFLVTVALARTRPSRVDAVNTGAHLSAP